MSNNLIEESEFKYLESNPGKEVLLLLHGLFGALSNFKDIIEYFNGYNVVVPILPIYTVPLKQLGLKALVDHIEAFVDHKSYNQVHLLGNSLGGHLAQLYALKRPEKVATLTLTGSSGLFESAFGESRVYFL